MAFRLRHRQALPAAELGRVLRTRTRGEAPACWAWSWPLGAATGGGGGGDVGAWVRGVRGAAVADSGRVVVFVGVAGHAVAVVRGTCVQLVVVGGGEAAGWCRVATSAALFEVAEGSEVAVAYVAVGYESGAVALFDAESGAARAVSRPVVDLPVRRLRFYPAFRLVPDTAEYPFCAASGGLFAVLGWGGATGQLPSPALRAMLRAEGPGPTVEPLGAGWVLWDLRAQDAVVDVAPCGEDPSSICDVDPPPGAAPLRVVAAGANPPIAAYACSADATFSFSARAAAKMAANTVLSVAKGSAKMAASTVFSVANGFLLSRIGVSSAPVAASMLPEEPTETPAVLEKAIPGTVRHSTAWADDGTSGAGINFGIMDMRDNARKSVSAAIARSRWSRENPGAATVSASEGGAIGRPFRTTSRASGDVDDSDGRDGGNTDASALGAEFGRQSSRGELEAAVQTSNLAQNARIVERVASAPLPCSLIATCDTLGRIFIQDPRDLCVLRILKGYRDGCIAWLARGGPLLVTLAPRLKVLEVHAPLQEKRRAAFRVEAGSLLVQSTLHSVFCIMPSGVLYELALARKGQSRSTAPPILDVEATSSLPGRVPAIQIPDVVTAPVTTSPPDYEVVGTFLEAVRAGHAGQAAEMLQSVGSDVSKVAHLMATLVTCASFVRSETHVALSSKAAQLAAAAGSKDLEARFEAYGRLAEVFGLVATDGALSATVVGVNGITPNSGPRLADDGLAAGLGEFCDFERDLTAQNSSAQQRRSKEAPASDQDVVNCERFILAHAMEPAAETGSGPTSSFILRPRSDLSRTEQMWLSKSYFARLLETDHVASATAKREHSSTRDIFLALSDIIALSDVELAEHFVTFFLNLPLQVLLNTPVLFSASGIRCALQRLRAPSRRQIIDQVLLNACETTSRVPNAVLLIRLCAVQEDRPSINIGFPFMGTLDRLGEALLLRRLVAGSSVQKEVFEGHTARHSSGARGDAERHAVMLLVRSRNFAWACTILQGLSLRNDPALEWHESASVSEAALHACRNCASLFMDAASYSSLAPSVAGWIKEAESEALRTGSPAERTDDALFGIRSVLLAAHEYFPDSSVDAVRCLQLAEAMAAIFELDKSKRNDKQDNEQQRFEPESMPPIVEGCDAGDEDELGQARIPDDDDKEDFNAVVAEEVPMDLIEQTPEDLSRDAPDEDSSNLNAWG